MSEKTSNVLAHLLSYLLHLMFVALWRKPVICRCPYGSLPGLTRATCIRTGHPPYQACEASPTDITQYRLTLYCWCEYATQGKRTLTGPMNTHPYRFARCIKLLHSDHELDFLCPEAGEHNPRLFLPISPTLSSKKL